MKNFTKRRIIRRGVLFQCFFILFLLFCSTKLNAQCSDPDIPDGHIQYKNSDYDMLKSIGQLGWNCSCTFIKTSENDNAPAYVLTCGHCIDFSYLDDENLVEIDFKPSKNISVKFNDFVNTQDDIIEVNVVNIEYKTMKGVDIAIARLDKTIGQMKALGLEPIKISQEDPTEGDVVKILGMPLNYDENGDEISFLKISTGTMTGKSPIVLENGWLWYDMFESDCKNVIGGNSGGPVFSCINNGLYGIVNTTNTESADFCPCVESAPCEVHDKNFKYDEKTNYTVDVRNILNCFNSEGVFDTTLTTFSLDKGSQITFDFSEMEDVGILVNYVNPNLSSTTNNLAIGLNNKDYYRYKLVSANQSFPRDINGYSDVFSVSSKPKITDAIPTDEGVYILSVIGGDNPTYDNSWQKVEFPTNYFLIVDTTPPEKPIIIDTLSGNETSAYYAVTIENYKMFNDALYRYSSTDLDFDKNDLSLYPDWLFDYVSFLQKNKGPYKYCAFLKDFAGNNSCIECKIFGSTNSNETVFSNEINVYPNPASNFINISNDNININKITIVDPLGKQVYSQKINDDGDIRLSLPDWLNGMYFMQIDTDQGMTTKKIMIN